MTELWLKPGRHVATELPLGRYVATELRLDLGLYVATERDERSVATKRPSFGSSSVAT